MLAITALHALVGVGVAKFGAEFRQLLDIFHEALGVGVYHHSGIEHASGVGEGLHAFHQAVDLVAPLPGHERRYGAACAVLSLE